MKREQTNIFRFFLEDCLPPVLRDWPPLNRLFAKLSGIDLEKCRQLRQNIPNLTPQQLTDFYKTFPRIQDATDNSEKCIKQILANIRGRSVCDMGCGTGYLLKRISTLESVEKLVGVDFSQHPEWDFLPQIEFIQHDILNLPFEKGRFDNVVTTHTLEHVLNISATIGELRRVCRQRLIIVVPRERESIWSFNPHFHYFPYEHSFLKYLLPLPNHWCIERIGRDYLYIEDY